jgi:hypothetical protein
MASITMMEEQGPRAHYFQSSVYRFNLRARAAVLSEFGDKIGNIPANCSYDAATDVSELVLSCISPHGYKTSPTQRI